MASTPSTSPREAAAARAVARVGTWLVEAALTNRNDPGARLRRVLDEDRAREFTVGIADGVLRPESLTAAAATLRRVAKGVPDSFSPLTRAAVRVGGVVAPVLPAPAVPLSRAVVRDIAGHLVVPLTSSAVEKSRAALRQVGAGMSATLTGAHVLGNDGAATYLAHTLTLARTEGMESVQVSLRNVLDRSSVWAFDQQVEQAAERLGALLDTPTTILVRIVRADEIDLALAVVDRVFRERPRARLGISLPGALPHAARVIRDLADRGTTGFAPTIRITTSSEVAEDESDAAVHGWESPSFDSEFDAQAGALRALRRAVDTTEHVGARIEFASDDPYLLAAALELATDHGARLHAVVPLGTPESVLRLLVASESGEQAALAGVSVQVPVAAKQDLNLALVQALRRARAVRGGGFWASRPDATTASSQKRLLRDVIERSEDPELPGTDGRSQDRSVLPEADEDTRIRKAPANPEDPLGLTAEVIGIARSAAATETTPIAPLPDGQLFGGAALVETAIYHEREDRGSAGGVAPVQTEPDTDASSAANRAWAAGIFATIANAALDDVGYDDPITVQADARRAGKEWGTRSAAERATVLRRFALGLRQHRGELIASAVVESGLVFAEADAEVTAAVDAAEYLAHLARELDATAGAKFVPAELTLVAADRVSSIAAPVEAMCAALASGSAVVLSAEAGATGSRLAQILNRAVLVSDGPMGLVLRVAPEDAPQLQVPRVLTCGSPRFLPPEAEVVGLGEGANSIIVAPSADVDQAVEDIVQSAFFQAGQAATNASVVILVGRIGRTKRFAQQLLDAVRSVVVAAPANPAATMGPIAEAPDDASMWAMAALEPGEAWLVEPRHIEGLLFAPGVRVGVQEGSRFHREAFRVPVLGVMYASSMADAIRIQNQAGPRLVAGLYTRDADDLSAWLAQSEAGTLVVNRAFTTPRARRHPVAAWDGTTRGPVTAIGGPNRLLWLGHWAPTAGRQVSSTLHLRGLDSKITSLVEAAQPSLTFASFERVRQGALADAVAWDREFGRVRDIARVGAERNLLRYRPVPTAVRAMSEGDLADVLRVLIAAVRTGSELTVSSPVGVPAPVRHALLSMDIPFFVETEEEWLQRMDANRVPRIRMVGTDAAGARDRVARALVGHDAPVLYAEPVTQAASVELLPFLREQVISITAHRDGDLDRWSEIAI